ncbi:MAG: hypothetical protein A2161_00020 [Candidatus Schekmanbacteria bacterium RBG_13_48_7]|uniref:Carbohydrate kinase PfkB domain-containing protein n=1 Tax=Candidatus Schekmanbacteria bacterium RBG_13_48_7 TaxID=1817878 RepID=A0A1F7RZU8_9BACT|nr:MAG: hypothetical protein A2161_00020 [Candidatus Schekmanbacteria bacterium RBG_13_48_7]
MIQKFSRDLKYTLNAFSKLKVLVIGDLMGDKYIWGHNLRLSKEAPVPVIQVQQDVYELGGAAHVAHNVNLLGARVYLCGLVGFDDAAQSLRTALTEAGIDSGGLFPTLTRPTTLKVRVMSSEYNTHLARFDYESNQPLTDPEMASLEGYLESFLDEINVIIISDYAKGIFNREQFAKFTIESANRAKIPTIVDTKPTHFKRFKDASVVICTLKEAKEYILLNRYIPMVDVDEIGNTLLEMSECKCLIIIHEDKGFFLSVFGQENFTSNGVAKKVYDSVGIEDTVTSVLALSLASGLNLQKSINLVMRAVDIVSSKPGTSVVTKAELMSAL